MTGEPVIGKLDGSLTRKNRGSRKFLTVLLFSTGTLLVTVLAPSVAAAAASNDYCNVLIGASTDGGDSPIVASACASTPEGADRALKTKTSGKKSSGGFSTQASNTTPLVYLYADINYAGSYTTILGDAGYCDSAGYSINLAEHDNAWAHKVSSIRGASLCTGANLEGANYNATQVISTYRCEPMPSLGSWNDNVLRIKPRFDSSCPKVSGSGG